jgi:hypothetical protein
MQIYRSTGTRFSLTLTGGNVRRVGNISNMATNTHLDVDVDVDWRGFEGRDLIPTHRKIS